MIRIMNECHDLPFENTIMAFETYGTHIHVMFVADNGRYLVHQAYIIYPAEFDASQELDRILSFPTRFYDPVSKVAH